MKKKILYPVIGLISLIISYMFFYFYLAEYLESMLRFTEVSAILTIITGGIVIYVIAIFAMERKVSAYQIDLGILAYFLMIISFSLFRNYTFQEMRMNPAKIIEDFNRYFKYTTALLIANTFVYFPTGIYARYRTKLNIVWLTLIFLVYIVLVEILQYILKRGVCDIIDIITNTLGFMAGALLFQLLIEKPVAKES